MHSTKDGSRGFTLIAALMLLLILSGISIGLLMMVNTEAQVGSQDEKNNVAFHAAEGGIEHMTSDLAALFQNIQAPTASAIEGLSALAPANTALMSYPVYSLTPATNPDGSLSTAFGQIATGPYEGLYAQILPVSLQVTAIGPLGDEVNMSRTVEVALVPVFQFGIFSDSDLSFFAGPSLDFNGRVHTNGDLYLSEGDGQALTFHDKVTAWGNVIRWELPNGKATNVASTHLGNVDLPTTSQGCDGAQPACRNMGEDNNNAINEGSITVGAARATWTTAGQNGIWPGMSVGTYHSWITDGNYGNTGGTGASQLSLPFVSGTGNAANGPQAYEIIRQPPAGELPTSLLGSARLYNEAAIRVLLADDPNELPHPGFATGSADPNNIRLSNFNDALNGVNNQFGMVTSVPGGTPALPAGHNYTMYFATGTTAVPDPSNWVSSATTLPADWLYQPLPPLAGFVTLFDINAPIMAQNPAGDNHGLTQSPQAITLSQCNSANGSCGAAAPYPYYTPLAYPAPPLGNTTWNLLDGYLRVEYRDAGGAYHPVTAEWLNLGFARGPLPPTAPQANLINPNAILVFQKPADRNGDGLIDQNGIAPSCAKVGGVWHCTSGKPPEVTKDIATNFAWYGDSTAPSGQSPTMYNWYPINFYDAREGETRDVIQGVTCTPAGVMNAVELDVGNLNLWLNGTIAGSGTLVDFNSQNGYVLYFSDRRGMLPNPNGTQVDGGGTKTGDSGFEDSVNTGSQVGTPDGALQATPPGKTESPEDDNNNGKLDNFGPSNLGLGLGYVPVPSTAPGTPYVAANNVNREVMATPAAPNPYLTVAPGRMPSCTVAEDNWVSGARHVLRLVDGSLGNVPVRPDNGKGGFTVGSENPLYIMGDYNTSAADPTWANPNAAEPAHSAAGVIADAVTMLSNNWSDLASFNSPSNDGGRPATTTYYRVAVAGGKNINFPVTGCCAAWAVGDWGTDGGLHNFLRQLENWGGKTLNYKGSMVSMYYSTYATGTDKNGGGTVYEPATRNYIFDPLFTQPQNLPPATPLFRDIDNLSYRQSFAAHTGCY